MSKMSKTHENVTCAHKNLICFWVTLNDFDRYVESVATMYVKNTPQNVIKTTSKMSCARQHVHKNTTFWPVFERNFDHFYRSIESVAMGGLQKHVFFCHVKFWHNENFGVVFVQLGESFGTFLSKHFSDLSKSRGWGPSDVLASKVAGTKRWHPSGAYQSAWTTKSHPHKGCDFVVISRVQKLW